MSKRIVLKSVAAVVMAGFILCASSCQKEEKKIIGAWTCDGTELVDFAHSESDLDPTANLMLRAFVLQFVGGLKEAEFTKDGNVIILNGMGKMVSTYKVSGSKLVITPKGGRAETYDISFPDKKTMLWDIVMDKETLEALSDIIEYWLEEEITITKCRLGLTFTKQ